MRIAASILLVLCLLFAAAPSFAEPTRMRHSGTVVAIDAERGDLVLAEIGPWHVERGETVVTRRAIMLMPETPVESVIRVSVPGGFAGDFLEVPLAAMDISVGDFVTVDCLHEHGRLIALRVTVAELE